MKAKKAGLLITLCLCGLLLHPAHAPATDYIWDGGGGGNQNWTYPYNWNYDSGYPNLSTDTATIGWATVYLDNSIDLGNLTVGVGTNLYFNHLKDIDFWSATVSNYGSIRLEQTGNYARMTAHGTVTLSGSGAVNLGADTGNQLTNASGGKFVNSSGHTIQGGGTIASPVDNYGLIKAYLGREMRVTNPINNYSSGILMAGSDWNSSLTLSANITGSGSIQSYNSGGGVYLDTVTFSGGPTFSGTGLIRVYNSSNIEGSFTNTGTIYIQDNEGLDLKDNPTVTNNGLIQVASSGNLTQLRTYNASGANTVTFAGSGAVELNGNANSKLTQYSSNDVFVNASGHTIRGGGTIAAPLTNYGALTASSGQTLIFGTDGSLTNTGTINVNGVFDNNTWAGMILSSAAGGSTVMGGGTLQSSSGQTYTSKTLSGYGAITAPVSNTGTVTASGGTLSVSGTVGNSGATLTTASGGALELHSTVSGGAVSAASGGTVQLHGAYLFGAALSGGTVTVTDTSTVHNGSASLASGGNLTVNSSKTLTFDGTATLSNSGTINLYGIFDNNTGAGMTLGGGGAGSVAMSGGSLNSTASRTYSSQTLSGYGTINAALTNTGTVTASGGTLSVNGTVGNSGASMTTASGGTLQLHSTVTGGTVSAASGGTVQLHGAYLSGAALSGGAVTVTDTSTVHNGSASLASGGNLTVNSSKTLTFDGSATLSNLGAINLNGALDNNTAANMTLSNDSGGSVSLAGGELKSTAGRTYSSKTLSGYGTISAALNNNDSLTASGGTLSLSHAGFANNGTVYINSGAAFDNISSSNLTLGGLVQMSGGQLKSTPGRTYTTYTLSGYGTIAAALTNNNLLTASGGTLYLTNAGFTNSGTVNVNSGAALDNNSSGAINLGSGSVGLAGGTLQSSAGRAFTSSDLAGYGTIAAALTNSGSLSATGGTLTLSHASFTNNGAININNAAILNNTSGSNINLGSGPVSLSGGELKATSGSFSSSGTIGGYGTVSAALTNTGNVYASQIINPLYLTGSVTNTGGALWAATSTSAGLLELRAGVSGGAVNPNNGSQTGTVRLAGASLSNAALGAGAFNVSGSSFLSNATLDADTQVNVNPGVFLHLLSSISGGQFSPGSGTVNLFGATLSDTSLGTGTVTVLNSSAFSGSNTTAASLRINDGQSLQLFSGATLTNTGIITVGSGFVGGASLDNPGSGAATLAGAGNVVLGGQLSYTINSNSGAFISNNRISGGGTIAAALTNNNAITATNGALRITKAVTNNGTMGADGSAILDIRSTVTGGDINPGSGAVQLNKATLSNTNLGAGNIDVEASSTLAGGAMASGTQLSVNAGTLSVTAAVSGSGSVEVKDNAGLTLQENLQAGNVTLRELAQWTVAGDKILGLTGNFSFYQQVEDRWVYKGLPGVGPGIRVGGGGTTSLEIGSRNYGLDPHGFNGNFHLTALDLSGSGTHLNLADAIDNGHRSSPEALYVEMLSVPAGTTLDLNNLYLYTYLNGNIYAVANGDKWFGDGDIIGSPVPLPGGLLLLGTGLLGLAMRAAARRRKSA